MPHNIVATWSFASHNRSCRVELEKLHGGSYVLFWLGEDRPMSQDIPFAYYDTEGDAFLAAYRAVTRLYGDNYLLVARHQFTSPLAKGSRT